MKSDNPKIQMASTDGTPGWVAIEPLSDIQHLHNMIKILQERVQALEDKLKEKSCQCECMNGEYKPSNTSEFETCIKCGRIINWY